MLQKCDAVDYLSTYPSKARNCDVYISGSISLAILKIAEIKKIDITHERAIFKQMFGVIFKWAVFIVESFFNIFSSITNTALT